MGEISNIGSFARSNAICNRTDSYRGNYKADGDIGGGIAFAIVGDHENRPTDMTNLIVGINDDTSSKTQKRCADI